MSSSYGRMGLGGLATLCAIISTIIIIIYHVKNEPSNYHVLFSTLGYFIFLLSLSWGSVIAGFYVDWAFMLVGLVLVILGLMIHIKNQGMEGADLHAYLGIAGAFCYALAFVVGLILYFLMKAHWVAYINFALTRAALTLGGLALITGLLKDNYRSWAPDWLFYLHIVLVAIFTVVLFVAFVVSILS